jgi:hypothetical protein
MEKEIISEIRELKSLVARLLGAPSSLSKEPFSEEAINKATNEFQKLSIERGDWVQESDIEKIIKSAPYHCGEFIRQEFKFTNYFKRGRTYYYNKSDLIKLGTELKKRNVHLGRYIEYVKDKEKFRKSVEDANSNTKGRRKTFRLDRSVSNVEESPAKMPSPDIIRKDIQELKKEFHKDKLSDYIDIYKDRFAMIKEIFWFDKYIDPSLKRQCRIWCHEFNYANDALKRVSGKKKAFIAVMDENMIEL